MKTSSHKSRLPPQVQQKLHAVRHLLRKYVLVQSLLLIACWVLIIFWAGGLLDYLPVRAGSNETPRWLRIGLLATMGLGSLWILGSWALPRLLTPLRDRSLALLIERMHPDLNNELVTAVELSSQEAADVSNPAAHQAMLERVRTSIAGRIETVSPAELFNWQPIWATGTAVVFGVLITVITAVGMPDWLGLWANRLFALSDEPWPRSASLRADGVQLQFPTFTGQLSAQRVVLPFDDGQVRVPSGATALLQISADAKAKRVPEVCTLFYRSDDGARGRANLRRVGSPREGWQQFTLDGPPLDGITQNISLDVVGLDARLRDLRLEVVEPAVVSAMEVDCQYPSYLLESLSTRSPQERLTYRAGMRIPEGTLVSLVGKASSQLSKVEFMLRKGGSESPEAVTPEIQVAQSTADQFTIELGSIRESQVVELRLIDEYGLPSDQILRYVITVLSDTAPSVESTLAGIGIAVTPKAVLPMRGLVTDDNGISDVVAEIQLNENPPAIRPLQLDRDGQIQTDIDLEQLAAAGEIAIEPEMTLGLVVTAHDYFDLDPQPHVGRGQPQQLAVVTEDQLLVILDRQELELRKRLEMIISELIQVDGALELLGSSLDRLDETAWDAPGPQTSAMLVSLNQEGNQVPAEAAGAAAKARAQQLRLAVLRAQQSMLQCDKSEQELGGVASRIDSIRQQLLNNRVDSYDRQERLKAKVHEPLLELLEGDYRRLSRSLAELQTASMSGQGFEQAQAAREALSKVLTALESIKENMFDIESFNQIVDLVRTLLEDQESLLEEAEKQQKARILDLLK